MIDRRAVLRRGVCAAALLACVPWRFGPVARTVPPGGPFNPVIGQVMLFDLGHAGSEVRIYSEINSHPPIPVWLGCDGREVSRHYHSALFEVIGTHYGRGDKRRTFNLPDFRGRVATGPS